MSWRDRLQRAVWKGLSFLTDSHDYKGGRRLVVHEFPGSDTPVVEDLGGKAGEYRVTAYFIGPDYDRARNALLLLLAGGGADWLTHPWLGRVYVQAREWSVGESNERGGFCTVSIDFVAAAAAASAAQVDVADTARAQVRRASDTVATAYTPPLLSADALGPFIAQVQGHLEVLRQAISLAALPVTWASQITSLVQGVKGDLAALAAVPGQYAAALQSIMDLIGAADGVDAGDRPRVVQRVAALALAARPARDLAPAASAEAALRARLLAVAAADTALADYTTAADRDAALAAAVAALEGVLLPAPPDDVFDELWALRTALIETLSAQALSPARAVDVPAPMPATVLAHRLGVSEEVFIAQNRPPHPLFVRGTVYG